MPVSLTVFNRFRGPGEFGKGPQTYKLGRVDGCRGEDPVVEQAAPRFQLAGREAETPMIRVSWLQEVS